MVGGHDLAVMINQTPYIQKIQGDSNSLLITSQESLNREVVKRQEDEQKEVVQSSESKDTLRVKDEGERKESSKREEKRKKREKSEEFSSRTVEEKGRIINIVV